MMIAPKRRVFIYTALVLLQAVFVALIIRNRVPPIPVKPEEIGDIPKPQLERINSFIEVAASAKTIEEANQALDDYDNDAISTTLSAATQLGAAIDEQALLNAVLKDRRVSRIYGLVRDLPPDVARGQCRALFQEKLKTLVGVWKKYAKFYKEATVLNVTPDLYWAQHSVRSAVFLCSVFCTASDVDEIYGQWAEDMEQAMEESGVDPVKYQQTVGFPISDVLPDELFALNIFVIVAHRHNCELRDASGELLLPIPVKMRSFAAWDVRLEGMRDAKGVLEAEIPYISGWGGIPYSERSAVLEKVRACVMACSVRQEAR